jgi:oxygen-independent coproporphyrinogen-3 oxidase
MKDLHLYLHIPFCQAKCPYCHFFSETPATAAIPVPAYGQYLQSDLIRKKREFNLEERQIKSIYFGGGTPSLLPIQEIEKILYYIEQLWPIAPNCEITLESNPHSLDLMYLKQLIELRINRLSLGIQTFNPKLQEIIRRSVELAKIKEILNFCEDKKIECGLDFIYALPEQTLANLNEDLEILNSLNVNHASFYELEIKDDTEIKTWHANKTYKFPKEPEIIQMYQLICEKMANNDWEHYEISNYAKKQKYAQHNLNFWLGNEYLGVGSSAGSRLCHQSIQNNNDLKLDADRQTFTKAENAIQYLMGSLRINTGLNLNKIDTGLREKMEILAKTWPKSDFKQNDAQALILNENGWLKYDYYLNELAMLTYDYYGES